MAEHIMDHRNESFMAKDAFYEQGKETVAAVPHYRPKNGGLKLYSDKECERMSSDCIRYSLTRSMSWIDFECLTDDAKRSYIRDMRAMYPGITIADFMDMFQVSRGVIYPKFRKLGIVFPHRTGALRPEGRTKFRQQMGLDDVPESPQDEAVEPEIQAEATPENVTINRSQIQINTMILRGDLSSISELLAKLDSPGEYEVGITKL